MSSQGAETDVLAGDAGAVGMAWPDALRQLVDGAWFWLATVRPDGRPHVVPVLAVGHAGELYFAAGAGTRKARNLARRPDCALTLAGSALQLTVEGTAAPVREPEALAAVAAAYLAKYEWPVEVRGGALYGEGAPTAGPPPYDVYRLTPTLAFCFDAGDGSAPTRWRFTGPR